MLNPPSPFNASVFDRSLDGLDHRLKLKRAYEHLRVLEKLAERFMESEPYQFTHYHNVEKGRYTVYAEVLRQPPPDWGPIIGDYIHNLRSSLDCLVYTLNIVGSKGNPKWPRQSQFPIYDDPWEFLSGRVEKMLWDVPGNAVAEIEALQPYNALTTIQSHPLKILSDLANTDKHRLLVPVVINVLEPSMAILYFNDLRITNQWVYGGIGPLKHDTEVARVTFYVIGPDTDMKVELRCPIDVGFPKPFSVRRYGLIKGLDWLATVVEDAVFRRLEPFILNPSLIP